ncbi:MAG: DEAD/DEAH box helicase [Candidatus Flexifilum sp.]
MTFTDLPLIEPLLHAVRDAGYTTPTPIQARAIPAVLAGRDLLGCAQTGTGKTAAFALPILQRLTERPAPSGRGVIRALVLSPTRELAAQIGDSFAAYGRYLRIKHQVIYGGVGQNPQVQGLQRRPEVLIATPGRLLDLMGQGYIRLASVEIFVLDEADRMLDMGFFPDVRRVIAALPTRRQTLLFSATMPEPIQELANTILHQPEFVEVTPQATTVEKIDQSLYYVSRRDKRALLLHLLNDRALRRVLIFTRTKHGANKLAEQLNEAGVRADAIHGNKSQSARERALRDFKAGRVRALVATDIAARGIDVDDVTHVINFDMPVEPESYVHRIGRTARAGAEGSAFSFCAVEERSLLRAIERLIRLTIPVVSDHPYADGATLPEAPRPSRGPRQPDAGRGHTARTMQAHTAREAVQQIEERTHRPKRRRSRSRANRPASEAMPTPLS